MAQVTIRNLTDRNVAVPLFNQVIKRYETRVFGGVDLTPIKTSKALSDLVTRAILHIIIEEDPAIDDSLEVSPFETQLLTDVEALDTRVTTNEGDIGTNQGAITALDGRVTTAEGNITTNAGDITSLDGRVTTAEGDITTNAGGVSTNAGDITSLDGRVTTLEGAPAPSSGPSVTTEALTIQVNPGTGTDDDVSYTTQAEYNTHGPFASIASAIRSIPSVQRHMVTIELSDGAHTVGQDRLGDTERLVATYPTWQPFVWYPTDGDSAHVKITSASGLVQVGGTSSMAVASASTGTINLSADPGYVANTYKGYHLKVTSGTGTGALIPIAAHTGTTWSVGNDHATVDATSVVQVVEPAASIQPDDDVSGYASWFGGGVNTTRVEFSSVHLDFTTLGGELLPANMTVILSEGTVISYMYALNTMLVLRDAISRASLQVDGGGILLDGMTMVKGSITVSTVRRESNAYHEIPIALTTSTLWTRVAQVRLLVYEFSALNAKGPGAIVERLQYRSAGTPPLYSITLTEGGTGSGLATSRPSDDILLDGVVTDLTAGGPRYLGTYGSRFYRV